MWWRWKPPYLKTGLCVAACIEQPAAGSGDFWIGELGGKSGRGIQDDYVRIEDQNRISGAQQADALIDGASKTTIRGVLHRDNTVTRPAERSGFVGGRVVDDNDSGFELRLEPKTGIYTILDMIGGVVGDEDRA
ncbi:MAG: hypothetical protein QM757_19030 [Paludibaculum sp.]